jgi:hypothetical protein
MELIRICASTGLVALGWKLAAADSSKGKNWAKASSLPEFQESKESLLISLK